LSIVKSNQIRGIAPASGSVAAQLIIFGLHYCYLPGQVALSVCAKLLPASPATVHIPILLQYIAGIDQQPSVIIIAV
jgi:hypothetical protein